jgi:hypothetical protein
MTEIDQQDNFSRLDAAAGFSRAIQLGFPVPASRGQLAKSAVSWESQPPVFCIQ